MHRNVDLKVLYFGTPVVLISTQPRRDGGGAQVCDRRSPERPPPELTG
jgi:hypothetical protein